MPCRLSYGPRISGLKIVNHFSTLDLATHYSKRAAQHYSGVEYRLRKLYNSGGRHELWSYLNEEEDSWRKRNLNSWLAAFYYAMASSEWILSGAFRG